MRRVDDSDGRRALPRRCDDDSVDGRRRCRRKCCGRHGHGRIGTLNEAAATPTPQIAATSGQFLIVIDVVGIVVVVVEEDDSAGMGGRWRAGSRRRC